MYNRGLIIISITGRHAAAGLYSHRGNMPEFAIILARWAAWAPGLESETDWAHWDGEPPQGPAVPDLSWLPPMQRRRLPALARGVFHVARQAGGDDVDRLPTVLASAHGELSRTLGLLNDLAENEPLSPAAFSLSVHNAVSGQLSIALGNRAPASCVALAGDGISTALLEAQCLAGPGGDALVVIYEAPLPEQYRPYQQSDTFPWALALRLGPGGTGYRLSRRAGSGGPANQGPALARFLAAGDADLTLRGPRSDWRWTRDE
jgi:hypothetical protein